MVERAHGVVLISDPAALNHTWPGVSPAANFAPNPVKSAWLGCAMAAPVAFYAFVFAAGLHHAYLHGWRTIPRSAFMLLVSYKTKAMGLIIEELRRLEDSPSDALLVSILILAAHGPIIGGAYSNAFVHPISPLAKTQNLDFYGNLDFSGAHMDALRLLVSRKGGLGRIQLYGLAETVAL
jgi:hypothetical protein